MSFIGMCHCEGYDFQAVYSGIWYIYISESLGLEQGVIFQETDQLDEDFSLDQGNQEMLLKNVKNQFCFSWTVVSAKQLLQDREEWGNLFQFRVEKST